ncbi:MAG: heavy metal-associated domain-containing protein, partial [Rhodothermales bacterium]|nr:heavy metal-associated domain-containing protein [Rhodothermales bacterium]
MEATKEKPTDLQRISLPIEGMTCAACASRVERRLAKEPGVAEAAVNYATEEAVVRLAAPGQDRPSISRLVDAVRDSGYGVRQSRVVLTLGPDAGSDAIDRLRRHEGVLNVAA